MIIRWVDVTEELPPDDSKRIVWLGLWCRWTVAQRHGSSWVFRAKDRNIYESYDVTHWLDPLRPDYDEINGEE